MQLQNLNEYDPIIFRNSFQHSVIYQALSKDFKHLLWNKSLKNINNVTSRQQFGETLFFLSVFYYLEKLTEKNTDKIYDLGCGWNIFKKYIPNIIGMDLPPDPKRAADDTNFIKMGNFADEYGFVNTEYIATHQEYFESVFSINALHFRSLVDLESIVVDFISMIKPNGRGFLAFNMKRFIERTSPNEMMDLFSTLTPSISQYDKYVRETLSNIPCQYLIVDIDLTVLDDWMDGNIRLVFEKS